MKTIEEAAREFCNIKQDLVIDEEERYYQNFDKYDGFKAGVEFAQRWISINDELPSMREYCLVKLSDGTDGYMKSLGLRSSILSRYTNVNASDELTITTDPQIFYIAC